jgi:hypothetical protein
LPHHGRKGLGTPSFGPLGAEKPEVYILCIIRLSPTIFRGQGSSCSAISDLSSILPSSIVNIMLLGLISTGGLLWHSLWPKRYRTSYRNVLYWLLRAGNRVPGIKVAKRLAPFLPAKPLACPRVVVGHAVPCALHFIRVYNLLVSYLFIFKNYATSLSESQILKREY